MIGQSVSHYRIEEKLGEGGMGVVYRAEDTRLGRQVALKALAPAYARDPNRRKRFQHEARAAARLNHPGIAAVYEMEEVGDDLYIVYEYVRGENLRAVVNRGGVKLEALLDIAGNVAAALAAAHSQGVVHRDLKPENIARTPDGNTKILDFGLARFQPERLDQETASHLTDAGSIVGTIAYMSPEQLEAKEVDFRTDIFSFGVLLYELATGVRPFEGGSPASTIARILTGEPVPMRERNPITPAELDRIVRKCLRKSPDERYQSTRDLQVDLENLRRETTGGTPRSEAAAEEAGLMQSALSSLRLSPRRWWEANQLEYVLFNVVMIYIGWKVKEWVGGNWGLALFLGVVVCAAASTGLRVILLGTAAVTPRNLPAEIRRVGPWARLVDLTFTGLLFVLAGSIVGTHPGWAALLMGFGVAGLVAFLIFEPALVRAAFPSGVPEDKALPRRKPHGLTRQFRLIAAIQLLYLLPLVYLLARSSWLVEDLVQWQQRGLRPSEALVPVGILGALLAGLLIGGATTLALWRGDAAAVRVLYRWFPLYVLIDIPGAGFAVAMTMKYANAAALLFVLPVLVYLPFYQRRRARELLAAFPEEAAPKEQAARPRRRWWPLALGLVATPGLVVLGVALGLNLGGVRERLLGTSAPRIESIAVLPLENLSGDPEQEYFADGMTEALISDLAQISALRVISRTSVMQYKGARKPLPEIARELNVDAVVEGSVQRAGDRVKITAQLIHAPTDKHLWAQSYERELRDVLALQSEVAQEVAQQIRATLTSQEELRLARSSRVNPEGYEAYLRGKFSFHKRNRDREATDTSIRWFEQAVQLDPESALAHAALAEAYTTRFFSHDPSREWEERAYVHIEKALALDPNLAEAYVARGDLAWTLTNHFPHERAIADHRRALELNPNLGDAHFSLGSVYMHIGLLDEAMKEFQTALTLDPQNLDARYRIPRVYLYQQDYEAALGEFERHPELGGVWYWQRAIALFYLKRTGEAFAVVDKLRREFPENEDVASTYAVLLAAQGRRREAEEQIRVAIRAGEGKSHFHHAAYNIASAYALMGRKGEALQWLRRTAEEGLPCYPLFVKDPNLDKLRGDPEFKTFLEEMRTQWERRRAALLPARPA